MNYSVFTYKYSFQLVISILIFLCAPVINAMEAWSIEKPQENFSQGIHLIFAEEAYEIVPTQIQEEEIYICPKSFKRYTENSDDISFETKLLLINFLSLPDLLRENIVTFLDSHHSLAFFARLPGISNKTKCKAYKKLKYLHTQSMIKRYSKNSSIFVVKKLFNDAISFANFKNSPNKRRFYSDLESLNLHTDSWFIDENSFTNNLAMYENHTAKMRSKLGCTFSGINYDLRIAFLALIAKKVNNRIKNHNTGADACNLALRYSTPCSCSLICLLAGCLMILSPSVVHCALCAGSTFCCTSLTFGCCGSNACFNCPERKCLERLASSKKYTFCSTFYNSLPESIGCADNLLSRNKTILALIKTLELIQKTQKNLTDAKNKAILETIASPIKMFP